MIGRGARHLKARVGTSAGDGGQVLGSLEGWTGAPGSARKPQPTGDLIVTGERVAFVLKQARGASEQSLPLESIETVDLRPASGYCRIRLRSPDSDIEFSTVERAGRIDDILDLIEQQRALCKKQARPAAASARPVPPASASPPAAAPAVAPPPIDLEQRRAQVREREALEGRARELHEQQRIERETLAARAAEEQRRREAEEKAAREQAIREQEARERAAREEQARIEAARAAEEQRRREAEEKAAREQANREEQARDRMLREQEARVRAAREQQMLEQDAREQAARDRRLREQVARDQEAREQELRGREARKQEARARAARDQARRDLEAQAREREAREREAAARESKAQAEAHDLAAVALEARERALRAEEAKLARVREQAARELAALEEKAREPAATEPTNMEGVAPAHERKLSVQPIDIRLVKSRDTEVAPPATPAPSSDSGTDEEEDWQLAAWQAQVEQTEARQKKMQKKVWESPMWSGEAEEPEPLPDRETMPYGVPVPPSAMPDAAKPPRSRVANMALLTLVFFVMFMAATFAMTMFGGTTGDRLVGLLARIGVTGNLLQGDSRVETTQSEFGPASADAAVLAEPAPPPPTGRELVAAVQERLAALGFDPGPADGLIGPKTTQAIATYQRQASLEATGKPTPELLVHLERILALGAPTDGAN